MEKISDGELGLVIKKVSDPNERKSCSEVCKNWHKIEALTRSTLVVKGHNPKFLTKLLPRYPNLLTFEAKGRISDSDLECLTKTNHNLQVLNLDHEKKNANCKCGITDTGLCVIAKTCHNLRKVCLSLRNGFGDEGVMALVRTNPKLTKLNLAQCDTVTDRALEAIASARTSLEVLNLRFCNRVTDSGLVELARGTPSLKELVVAGCYEITDQALYAIASTSLVVLNMEVCGITGSGLAALAKGVVSKTLKELVISHCDQVTIQALEAVASNPLQALVLDNTGITDVGLYALAKGVVLQSLKKLHLAWCTDITDCGLWLLQQQMCCLEDLNLRGCGLNDKCGLTVSSIHTLKKLDLGFWGITDATLVAIS